MTVSSATRVSGPYTGTSSLSTYPFTFKVFAASDLLVIQTDLLGNESTLSLTTNYTVALNSNQDSNPGGTVTLTAGVLATGYLLTITSNISALQQVDLTNQGGFYPAVINTALDKLTILVQQCVATLNRAVLTNISSSVTPANLISQLYSYVTAASNSATASANSAASSLSYLNTFKGQYYGSAISDPSLDPLGNPCTSGDLYFNSATLQMKTYTGSSWQVVGVAVPITITTQQFSGTGSQTVFTLTSAPAFQNASEVYISGAVKVPGVDYTISGLTLTFTSAPASGTNNIFVKCLSSYAGGVPNVGSVTTASIAAGAVTASTMAAGAAATNLGSGGVTSSMLAAGAAIANVGAGGVTPTYLDRLYIQETSVTGSAVLPTGTTAQRDVSPLSGYIRFNSSLTAWEGWNGSSWVALGGGATGGGSDQIFVLNGQTINNSYTIPTGQNAHSTGPVAIATGKTVTVPSGSRWVIL